MERAWWHVSLLLVCMALPLQLAHGQTRQSGRGASVALTAKWNSTATVLEAAEFLVSMQMHPLEAILYTRVPCTDILQHPVSPTVTM